MAIATSIFLSTLIVAAVIMYALTMNRWDWRKLIVRGSILVGTAVLLSAGGLALFTLKDRILPPSIQTEYSGLRLGMTKDEVKYAIGYPNSVIRPSVETEGEWKRVQKITATKDLKDKKVEDYNDWQFARNFGYIEAVFDEHDERLIVAECLSQVRDGLCPAIHGIKDGDTEQTVLQRFGTPDYSRLIGVTKEVYYTLIGIFFYLTQEQVYLLGINDIRYKFIPTN